MQTNLTDQYSNADIQATVTSKAQVTIPLKIRQVMQVKPGDHIVFRLERNSDKEKVTVLRSSVLSLDETFASVKPIQRPEDFKRLREIAREEKVEHELEKYSSDK